MIKNIDLIGFRRKEEKMKKSLFLSAAFASAMLLGGQSVFAAQAGTAGTPSTAQTPVTSTLTAPTNPNPEPPPGPVDPENPTGNFGIAYRPSAMSFSETLTTGAMSIGAKTSTNAAYGSTHVGVLDTTYETKGWDLTAQLNWNGTAVPGATIKSTVGTVKENINDGQSAFNPATDLVTPGVGADAFTTPSSSISISSTGSQSVLKAAEGKVYTGTYDLELSNISLEIPNGKAVTAGAYNGTINWNLSLNP